MRMILAVVIATCLSSASQGAILHWASGEVLSADLIPGPGMDASGRDLGWALLSGFDLSGANFDGASLFNANLSQSNLTGATFHGTRLDVSFIDSILFGVDFTTAVGLNFAAFHGALCDADTKFPSDFHPRDEVYCTVVPEPTTVTMLMCSCVMRRWCSARRARPSR